MFLLQNNTISAVEPGSFQNQGELLELALNGNRIHLVTADMFQGLEHLRILYLAGNDITRLLDYTFRGLQVRHIRAHVSCLLHFTFNFDNKLNTMLCKMHSQFPAHLIVYYCISSVDYMYHPLHVAAFAGTSFAAQQYRDVSRPGSGWLDFSGPAGPKQEQSSYHWPCVPATSCQPAGAAHHR